MAWLGIALGVVAAGAPLAFGAASDPFAVALPGRDTQPPEGQKVAGQSNVSEQQGSASYAIPIEVPPGRNGIAPSLALSYSSSAPLRGGLAVGWALNLPTIERDPANPSVVAFRYDGKVLVPAPGDAGAGLRYRVEHDESFARIEKSGPSWMVSTPDGRVRTFIGSSTASDLSTRWNLTSERDAFGNTIVYSWSRVDGLGAYTDFRLNHIEYTSNAAAGLAAHARVDFSYASKEVCTTDGVPRGAQSDHHFGRRSLRGSLRLTEIKTSVRDIPTAAWREARKVALTYDATELLCTNDRPPLRYLTQVDVSARSPAGVWAAQPPIKLGYGPKKRELSYTTLPFMGRHGEYGTEKGPEGSIMDFDGDGIADLVRVALPAEGTQRCRFFWRRGSFGGGFASFAGEQMVELPTAAWEGPGGAPAGTDSCTLNGQLAWRSTEIYGGGSICKQAAVQVGYHFMDWDRDGDLDLVTSNWTTGTGKPCGDFGFCPVETSIPDNVNTGGCNGGSAPMEGGSSGGGATCGCPLGEVWNGESCEKQCPSGHERDPSTGACQQSCDAFVGCGGSGPSEPPQPPGDYQPPACGFGGPESEMNPNHIWRIYPNESGQLDLGTPIVLALDMPLPPNGGELAPPHDGQPSLPTLTDIDGDGWLDLVKVNDWNLGQATHLLIWRGDGEGGFSTASTSWTKPSGSSWLQKPQKISVVGPDNLLSTSSTAQLVDFDGDGLDDIVVEARNSAGSPWSLYVSYNMGGSFAPLEPLGFPGAIGQTRTELQNGWSTPMPMTAGWRAQERILADLDADGLPELTLFGTPMGGVSQTSNTRVALRFNGDALGNYTTPGAEWEPLERLVRAVNPRAWYRVNDFVDLTGDGLPDLLTWNTSSGAYPEMRTDQPGAEPLRLLTTVDNGRGAVTRFGYARSTDPSAVSVAPWTANEPRWVVTSVTVTPGFGQPDMVTAYHYEAPQRGTSSAYGKTPPGFLGYAKVTSSRAGQDDATGAISVKSFDYTGIGNDHRGHLISEWTYLRADRSYTPVRYETHSYTTAPLVGGLASFTYADTSTVRVCGVNATEAQCAVEDRNVKTTRQTWAPWNGIWAGPIFYENVQTTVEAPRADGTLEKLATVRDFAERAGLPPLASTDYRILQIEEQQQRIAPGGVVTLMGRTRWYHDGAGLPYDTYSHITGSILARTTRTFDATTGQLLTERRPNQAAIGGTKVTTFVYDAHKLFVAQTINELGHKVIEKRDVATGVLVRREGPNVRTGQADPSCVPIRFVTICPIVTNYEPEEWVIDGFGRVTERRVATDPPGGGTSNYYLLTPVEWTFYYDQALPNQRKTQALRDFTGSTRVTRTDHFDGLGRVLEHHEARGGTLLDAITSYGYDAGGALRTVSVPDPRVDTGAVVTYTYTRDGLGRVIAQGKPDGSAELVNYYGPDVQVHTFSPTDGTEPGTELRYDPFGRLEAVNEFTAEGGDAVTEYGYDELGRMTRVRDADGNLTVLAHDWVGNRTAVTRGARTWSYLYDFDGNLIQETSPVPTGEAAADHTSITEYDVLDRVVKHTPASRGMSDTRRQQLGIGPISTTWDSAPNAIGQQVRATMPFGTIDYSYDVQHQVKREQRTISLGYGASMTATQSVDRSYNALGSATSASWDDGTRWTTSYDARGLVSGVMRLDVAGGVYLPLAGYTRSLAGAPRQRLGGMYDQQREWQYDALGRVTYDRVYRPSTNASLSERSYGYDGFGRLRTVDGQVDGMTADALYDYDNRGRVKRAQGPYGYDANLDYSSAGNVTHAAVAGAADVPDRDVTYQYGAVDPMAVDRLLDTSGNVVADLDYDLAGNMIQRALPDGNVWTLTVDASDQIREVSGPNGTETYYFGPNAERMVAIGPDGVKWWFGESETHFTPNGVQTQRWHHISTGEPIARIENQSSFELQYSDALQNLILSVAPTGEVAASFLYGAFGELVATSGDEKHRRQFNGKENDRVSGLRHYGYRSYDPLLLRWTAADPKYRFAPDVAWAEPQRANLYAFSLNNPVQYLDPDGRDVYLTCAIQHGGTRLCGAPATTFEKVAGAVLDLSFWGGMLEMESDQGKREPQAKLATQIEEELEDGLNYEAESTPPAPLGNGPGGPRLDTPTPRESKSERRARERREALEKKKGDEGYQEPASEGYAEWKARQAQKRAGKEARRKGHDQKDPGEGDRSKDQLDEDYDE